MTEPVSLEEMRMHLRIDPDDEGEDDLIIAMITAACRGCENYLNRSVIGTTRVARFSAFPRYPYVVSGIIPSRGQLSLYLEGGEVASVQSVTYVDTAGATQTLSPSLYSLDAASIPAVLTPLDIWPVAFDRPGAVTVSYTLAAMSTEDTGVVGQAIKLMVGHWYQNRESVVVDVRGIPTEIPLTVSWLLSPLRVIPFR